MHRWQQGQDGQQEQQRQGRYGGQYGHRQQKQQNTWNPGHGIVFSTGGAVNTATPRPSTAGASTAAPADAGLRSTRGKGWRGSGGDRKPTGTAVRSVHTAAEAGPVGDSAGGGRLQDAEAKNGPSEGPAPNVANVLPPESTLDYTIPVDVFRRARAAPAGCPESFWSYALYRRRNGADGSDGRVKVHYSRSLHTTERVCREFFLNEPVLGFDLEWMPDVARWEGARRNVCLVQLASPSRIGLFHLSVYPEKRVDTMNVRDKFVAPTLGRILEDENILKLGVSIKGDATRLQNHVGVKMRGLFELSHLHRLVKYVRSGDTHLINRKLVSLATQVEENIGLPLYKGQDVRSSDWSRPLQMDQIVYAYAAVQLFAVLERRREGLDPKQPRPALAELDQPIRFTKPAAEALKTDAKPAQPAEKEALPAQIQKLGG